MAQRRWDGIHANLKPVGWSLPNDGETVYVATTDDSPDGDFFEERLAEIRSDTTLDEPAPEPPARAR